MTAADKPKADSAVPVSRAQAFAYWLKLGCISFGGPAGQIALMHAELVEKRRWISERRFLHALNFCMMLPGPEAQQLATYIGWLMHGRLGGLIAGGLFVLPSLLLLMLLSWLYLTYGQLPLVAGFLSGIKPAVVAIILFAAWRIAKRTLGNVWLIGIAISALLAIAALHTPFPFVILFAAIAGTLLQRYRPDALVVSAHKATASESHAPALIDDDTTLAHLASSSSLSALLVGIGLIALLLTTLFLALGFDHTLARMGLFFTQSALLTFGGAYAVLPYVVEHAVNQYHWLTAAQMLDGLALGETTPGPLIMIVAFVGFVGGWTHALFGADQLLAAGIAGACVATLFTFLPSFVFIFSGAPWIERSRGNLHLQAPLTAISEAVVGVIVNLGLYFGTHVFFLDGLKLPNWNALLIFTAVALAVGRFKVGMIPVIIGSGLAGLALSWLYV